MISPRLLLIVALRAAGAAADCSTADEGYVATLFEEGKTCETQVTNLGTFDTVDECAAAGAAFARAAALLAVLVVTHGIGSYWEHLRGHRRHRQALLFALAQDLSVFGALALLALVGPGDLSVDARRAKRQ